MAVIGELGIRHPCRTEGDPVDLNDDQAEMYPGEILELVYEVDGDLNRQTASEIIHNTLKMKEDYPLFVIHYIKCETRSVIVQVSIAPHEAAISGNGGAISGESGGVRIAGLVTIIIAVTLGILTIIAAITLLPVAVKHGWILGKRPATGHAEVVARDMESDLPIPDVNITVAGQTKKTGPNGEAVLFEDLTIGAYTVIGEEVDGYQSPEVGSVTIVDNAIAPCTLWYSPEGYVEPTHGWLSLATAGAKGDIYIHGQIVGEPGYAYLYLEKGDYDVYFGPVEGYITPPMVTRKVVGGKTTSYVAYYELPEVDGWEKYIKYALIGGGVIIGAAVLIPQVIQIATRPRKGGNDG